MTDIIMRKINPKCTNSDSFKYSILISLHYYDITPHPERINKLAPFINNYNFIDRSPENFEKNNTNISLTVYNESGIIIHTPTNNSSIKARIVKINNYRYHAVKPPMPKLLKKKSILLSLPHKEL